MRCHDVWMLFYQVALQAEQDVKKALSNFEKTGRVPASVMESRYVGHFTF